jgi:uncharacterized protein with HEPN domain
VRDVDRVERWLDDLSASLTSAADLVGRGREAFDADPALPLAFEVLCNRAGELAKRLVATDPVRFHDAVWAQAARNRDFGVHHCDRLDAQSMWSTVSTSFPLLQRQIDLARSCTTPAVATAAVDHSSEWRDRRMSNRHTARPRKTFTSFRTFR